MTENTLAPVDLGTAQRIDSALRAQTRTVAGAMADWRPLIEEARDKGIYKVLGFTTWPAYIADVIHSHMGALLPADRLRVVEVLCREGMSQHAIATALNVNQATISRDQRQLMHDASVDGASADDPSAAPLPPKVTGLDGKQRRRPVPASQPIAVTKSEKKVGGGSIAVTKSEKVIGGGSIIVDPVSVPVPEVDSHVALVDLDAETRMQAPISGPQKPAEAQNQAKTDKQYEKADRKAQRAAWMSDNEELTERNAELAKTNAELTKKIAKARENLGAACKQVAELKAELAERDQTIAELAEVRAKLPAAKPKEPQEDRLLRGVLAKLSDGPMTTGELRGKFQGKDRPALDAVLEKACAEGVLVGTDTGTRNGMLWELAQTSELASA